MKITMALLVLILFVPANWLFASNYEYTSDREKKEQKEKMNEWQAKIGNEYLAKANGTLEFHDAPRLDARTFTLNAYENFKIIGLLPRKLSGWGWEGSDSYYKVRFHSGKIAYVLISDLSLSIESLFPDVTLVTQATSEQRDRLIARNRFEKKKRFAGLPRLRL